MTQERYFLQPEFTLAKFCIQFMLSQPKQDNPQMRCMICLIFRVNQDIIDKHDHELIELRHEYRIHQIHEIGRSICQSKRHDQILIQLYLVEKAVLGISSSQILI